jgi:uncharacterized protein
MNRHLVIFAKAPRLGRVKSRLSADVGAVAAWRFQRDNLSRIVRRLRYDARWTCWLAVTGEPARWPVGLRRFRQGAGDLGQRMQNVMETLPHGPVVLVGADIPGIQPGHIERAFRKLGSHDVVFGPASDGGYWLVGFRRRPVTPTPFTAVRWSSEHALADTVANLDHRRRVAYCDELSDVDDGKALADYVSSNRGIISTKLQGMNR